MDGSFLALVRMVGKYFWKLQEKFDLFSQKNIPHYYSLRIYKFVFKNHVPTHSIEFRSWIRNASYSFRQITDNALFPPILKLSKQMVEPFQNSRFSLAISFLAKTREGSILYDMNMIVG